MDTRVLKIVAVPLLMAISFDVGIYVTKERYRRDNTPILAEVMEALRQKEPPPSECSDMAERLKVAEIRAKVANDVAQDAVRDCGRYRLAAWGE